MLNYNEYLDAGSEIMLGKLVIKGTRIPVTLVLQRLAEGASVEELMEAYPALTLTSIMAVLAYASNL